MDQNILLREYEVINSKIQHVAILTDEACISAAESFILEAKSSSDKVKTFGSPTGGVIDYTSVSSVVLEGSGKQHIIFGFPTSTLHKDIPLNGYNETGIVPDVYINNQVQDKIKVYQGLSSKVTCLQQTQLTKKYYRSD